MFRTLKSVALVGVLCLSSTVFSQNKIVIDGSTTVGPIMKAFAEYYMSKHKDVNITVSESGSGNGAKSLINSSAHIGIMSRFLKDTEFKAAADNGVMPIAHIPAMDGMPVVVHPSNSVKNLTIEQIRDVYTGKIISWKELGGPNQPIILISRETNSGTYETFNEMVMNKNDIAKHCEYVGSNGAVRQRVQSTPNAIGYVGLGFLDNSLKAVTVNGIEANRGTISSGKYPISRALYMFTNGYPKLGTHLHSFVLIHLTRDGQEMIESIGFIPITQY